MGHEFEELLTLLCFLFSSFRVFVMVLALEDDALDHEGWGVEVEEKPRVQARGFQIRLCSVEIL